MRHLRFTYSAVLVSCSLWISQAAFGDDLDKERWNAIAESEGASHSKDVTTNRSGLSWQDRDDSTHAVNEHKTDAGDPHQGSQTWFAPPPEVQMSRDGQLPPVMMGGIFVPTMTGGISEPKFQVQDSDGKLVKESYTGSIAYVPPGDYSVMVGTLVADERPEFEVHVVEGSTTLVPVEWSGLVVRVVNDRGATIRGNYEIVSLPDRNYIGLGSGALINEGERLSTWLLWPGKYMIISAGEGYQARKNFITVDLNPGELSRVTLVLDEDTGNILGGGEIDTISAEEEKQKRWWWAGVLIGGSVRFNRVDDVVGKATGQVLDLSAFLESYFTLGLHKHFLYTRLNAEIGGMIRFENRPFLTTVDTLKFELLYTYRLVDWFGPFARFSFESNMAPVYQELKSPHTVNKYNLDGELISEKTDQMDVQLSPPFSPIRLNAGIGGRFDVAFGAWFKMSSRIGAAYRNLIIRDLYIIGSDDDDIITLIPVENTSQFGFEAALTIDLTPIQWFTLKVDATLLEPFNDWYNPIIDLDVDAAIRLSSIASLSYTLRLNYDVSLIDKVQIDQYIQLRFSYKIY